MTCPSCGTPLAVLDAERRLFGDHLCERVAWRAWHTRECAVAREDPGATCICRPPATDSFAIGFGR